LHTALQVFLGIAQFVVVVLASVVIGFVVGMIAAFITRFSEHVHGEYMVTLSVEE
jgi:NhaP-type Na+/H+ or K+/H+ antiporter